MEFIQPGRWDENFKDPDVEAKVAQYVDLANLPKEHIMHRIERGRKGMNIGLSTACPHVDKYTYGLHQGRYYLIGADSGVGKTTISDYLYVINAWLQAKFTGRKLYIIYYSFEISREEKILRWLSYFVYALYGESLPADYIDGKITGMSLSAKHLTMVHYAQTYVDQMLEDIDLIEDPVHPTKMFHDLIEEHYEKIGKIQRRKPSHNQKKGTIFGWEPNDPLAVTLVVCDHMALIAPEQGFDMKQTMDLWSKYIVTLRNLFNLTFVGIQQFNTEMTTYHRMGKKGDGLVAPQRVDFGDSRYTFRDANVVWGLVKPSMYDIDSYSGYDVKTLKDYFVACHLMKNRHGAFHKMLPLFLNPIAGNIEGLPTPPIDIAMDRFEKQVIELEKKVQLFTPK